MGARFVCHTLRTLQMSEALNSYEKTLADPNDIFDPLLLFRDDEIRRREIRNARIVMTFITEGISYLPGSNGFPVLHS